MRGVLVDACVILDVFLNDPVWADWSEARLEELGEQRRLFINPVVYTEVSIGFESIETLEAALHRGGFEMLEMPREALFLAGKVFLRYHRNRGVKTSPLPDFYIGAHGAVLEMDLLTRDVARYRTYFPTLRLISP